MGLPHQEGDHAGTGRGRRGGWRTAHERRHLAPWGRRKPNGSAFHRRIMAGVQDAAKHAMSAISPLKSWLVEKPQPKRKMTMLVAMFAVVLLATRLPSR
jgi:hypothetical protein